MPRWLCQPTAPTAAQEYLLAAGTLDKALAIRKKNAEMLTADPNDPNVEGPESVCPVKDLELLLAGVKQLLVAGALDKVLFAQPEDVEILPVDPDNSRWGGGPPGGPGVLPGRRRFWRR